MHYEVLLFSVWFGLFANRWIEREVGSINVHLMTGRLTAARGI
jgi:hypothetical protein